MPPEGPYRTLLSKKRECPGLIASVNLGDLKEGSYRDARGMPQIHLVIDITLWDEKGEPYTEKALIDSSTEANIVSQRLVKECSWSERGSPIPLQSIKGQPIFVYRTHEIKVEVSDRTGETQAQSHEFAAIDLDIYSLVLGYPWLYDINPTINFRGQGWEYRKSNNIEVLSSQEFATVLEDENILLFGAFFKPGDSGGIIAILSEGITQEIHLPDEYMNFLDVFDEAKAAELLSIDGPTHPIELEEGASPP